jgi:hypothetical protein
MIYDLDLKVEDFAALTRADAGIAAAVAAEGCPYCDGPLHVANYQRKPRGGVFAEAGEDFSLRHSLCCGRRGCRRRVLPPSLRFLGRRVYLELAVLLASAFVQIATGLRAAARQTAVPARTLERWLCWWREEVPRLGWWAELRARLAAPGPDESTLPRSLLTQLGRVARGADLAWLAAKCLAPGTTRLADAARFARDAARAPGGA